MKTNLLTFFITIRFYLNSFNQIIDGLFKMIKATKNINYMPKLWLLSSLINVLKNDILPTAYDVEIQYNKGHIYSQMAVLEVVSKKQLLVQILDSYKLSTSITFSSGFSEYQGQHQQIEFSNKQLEQYLQAQEMHFMFQFSYFLQGQNQMLF
ncbi:transmembrane protein, putative (macronuclear) [Tetrahymena thermophila SB210]|uniref:Transmembrane protein, putative n=1 Tax=Tetrahymena thermophila (strain SB210) TaxID=312017 RepID=W7XKL1_TETTS|nr:transmembrane protein, putative [Tetrahymena thermophila SB210]EWS76631.1 transmembrane protein, putative [Tetrahymena thermophila SB210]|eukprot:XP_012650799.1 transmembrane protein, putative [Tetrahymena thermophila SB210]